MKATVAPYVPWWIKNQPAEVKEPYRPSRKRAHAPMEGVALTSDQLAGDDLSFWLNQRSRYAGARARAGTVKSAKPRKRSRKSQS